MKLDFEKMLDYTQAEVFQPGAKREFYLGVEGVKRKVEHNDADHYTFPNGFNNR
jgi:hypothetical protein